MNKIPLMSLLAVLSLAAAAVADDALLYGEEGMAVPSEQFHLSVTQRTIDLLAGVMNQPTGPGRIRQAADLGRCGPGALPPLLNAVADPDPLLRATAAHSIGMIGGPAQPPLVPFNFDPAVRGQAVQALAKLASDSDPAVRCQAILASARLGDTTPVAAALADPDELVQAAALNSASTPAHAAVIVQRYASLPLRLQTLAADALGRIGDATGASVLLPLPANLATRAAAIHALGQMKATAQPSQLANLQSAVAAALNVQTENPSIRRQAILALGQLAAIPERQKYAMGILESDPDATVRQAAAQVLEAAPTPDALSLLAKQLDDDYMLLHDAARLAIVAVADPAVPLGAQLMDNSNPRRREDGSFILGQLRSSQNLQRHIELTADADFGVAAQAARSMYRIVPPTDVAGPALMNLLNRVDKLRSDDDGAGRSAILAMGRIRYQSIVARSLRWVPTPPPKTYWPPGSWRPASVWAIGMTADNQSPEIQKLLDVITDHEQGPPMAYEAIKAMGNSNNKKQECVDLLKDWDKNKMINRSVKTRWMAHYVSDRLNGTTTPYTDPPSIPQEPEVSIKEMQ